MQNRRPVMYAFKTNKMFVEEIEAVNKKKMAFLKFVQNGEICVCFLIIFFNVTREEEEMNRVFIVFFFRTLCM